KALFYFEGAAVIVGDARVGLHEEIADFWIPAASVDRFAARQHARLKRVQVTRVTDNLTRAEKQVSGGDGDAAADLVRDLRARLVTVRRLDGAVEGIGEPDAARGGNLTGEQKVAGRRGRRGPADRSLLKTRCQWGDCREEQ